MKSIGKITYCRHTAYMGCCFRSALAWRRRLLVGPGNLASILPQFPHLVKVIEDSGNFSGRQPACKGFTGTGVGTCDNCVLIGYKLPRVVFYRS